MRQRFSNLREYMDARGMTEVAAAQFFGCSKSTISRILRRERRPGGRIVVKMIAAGIDVSAHLEGPLAS